MAYHDDLLRQAVLLVHKERRHPKQASLRRAVSTAYYALFHLLINDAVANWGRASLRTALGRAFDHSNMKSASNRIQDRVRFPFTGENATVALSLRLVAKTFAGLQGQRHVADYDNAKFWTKTDALALVEAAEHAFKIWKSIRNEQVSQSYLVSLLAKNRD